MSKFIIGLDFGNTQSHPYVIWGMNDVTRLNGEPVRLVPPVHHPYGIPSVYFYTNRHGKSETYVGYDAVRATPVENRLRCLKHHLNETVTLDDKDVSAEAHSDKNADCQSYAESEASATADSSGATKKHDKKKKKKKTIPFDIGIRLKDPVTGNAYIDIYLKAGTPVPCKSPWHDSYTGYEGQNFSRMTIFQAKVKDPDPHDISHYTEIGEIIVDHGKPLPRGVLTRSRILIDENGVLSMQGRSHKNAGVRVTGTYKLNNLD